METMRLVLVAASRRKATVRGVGGTISAPVSASAPSSSVSYECSPMSTVSVVVPRELAILPVSDTKWIS